jgi:hypothetical protein
MSRCILAILVWLLPWAADAQPVLYQPAGAGFRVEFPGKPEIRTRDLGAIRVLLARYETQDMTFMAAAATLPPAAAHDPHGALDAARNDAIGSEGRTLLVERRLSVWGQPARRLILDDPGRRQRVVMLLVVRGDRLYRLSVEGDPRPTLPVAGERFIGSFALTSN